MEAPRDEPTAPAATRDDRRSFVAALGAVATGAVVALVPLAAGVASFLTPLFRKRASTMVRVALLEQTPDDGVPRAFPVLADRVDAWNRYPAQRIGAVYLVRPPGAAAPVALAAKCPHAGCFIGFTAGDDAFRCPCHTSAFKLDGKRVRGDAEVAPRDMDPLKVELRTVRAAGGGRRLRRRLGRGAPDPPADDQRAAGGEAVEVWVEFVDYETGHKERIATA